MSDATLGIAVAWYPGFVGTAITVGRGWVTVEPQPPVAGDSRGPVYRHGLLHRRIRRHYQDVFHEMWEACTKEEDGEPYIDPRFLDADPARIHALVDEIRRSASGIAMPLLPKDPSA